MTTGPGVPYPDESSKGLLPPAYRKSMLYGVTAWLMTVAGVAGWLIVQGPATISDIDARTPQATAQIKSVYLTPQITDDAPDITFDAAPTAAVLGQGAYVTLVMTGLGLSEAETERAIEDLPPAVVLAFSPYGRMKEWIGKAQGAEHETLALLPMEPDNYPRNDPGPRALLTRVTEKENAAVLGPLLLQGNGATGVMNFMGSAFLKNERTLLPVFKTLDKAGAIFLEQGSTLARDTAIKAELPYLSSDIEIDAGDATEAGVSQKLIDLERIAREKGHAIGIASPYPVTFNMIKSWYQGLESRGVKLIPLSAMQKVQERDAKR